MGRTAPLGRRRQVGGWAIALLGPVVLAASLVPSTDAATLAVESMAFLALTVLCALVGGLWPAVTSALLSTGLLTWYFTLPRRTLLIERTSDVVVLVLFLLVAVSVSLMVGHAARRTQQATESRREADALVRLNRLMLDTDQGAESLLALVRETFAVDAVALLRPVGRGVVEVLASVGDDPPLTAEDADEVVDVVHDRQPLHLALRGAPLSASERRVLASFADHLSVALERRALAERAARAHLLEDGNRVRNALLAAVSHDLRTPLARTKAAVSSLRSEDVDWTEDERRELLATIEDSTDLLHTIVANLLDLSRIQSDAVRPVLQDMGLEDVVARTLDHVDGSEVSVVADPDLPQVRTDAGLLERVVANLLDNARRHAPPGTPVSLELSERDGRVVVRVVDHGPGVEPADKETMFGAFQRLGDAESRDGLGLGLAVARGLVEAMDGRLTAEDTPGGGLTMVVDLPATPRPARPTHPGGRSR